MSGQGSIKIVQSMYEVFGRGDIGYILDRLSEDVLWENRAPSAIPWSGTYKGKTAVPAFFAAIADSVDTELFSPEQFIAQDDDVVVTGRYGAKVKATGSHLSSTG